MLEIPATVRWLIARTGCWVRRGHDYSWVTAAALGSRRPVCTRCGTVAGPPAESTVVLPSDRSVA